MKQEDKDLLLKDLCARLPYGVIVREYFENGQIDINPIDCGFYYILDHTDKVRPYLRPMSSMTEEELKIYNELIYCEDDRYFPSFRCSEVVDWLNKNMFDYRGLITKGLALEVNKKNNPYEY